MDKYFASDQKSTVPFWVCAVLDIYRGCVMTVCFSEICLECGRKMHRVGVPTRVTVDCKHNYQREDPLVLDISLEGGR